MLPVLQKISYEIINGSGCANTPEPEELRGLREIKPEIHPTNSLTCTKPIRNPGRANRTFHRYTKELWAIQAGRMSVCPIFEIVRKWSVAVAPSSIKPSQTTEMEDSKDS